MKTRNELKGERHNRDDFWCNLLLRMLALLLSCLFEISREAIKLCSSRRLYRWSDCCSLKLIIVPVVCISSLAWYRSRCFGCILEGWPTAGAVHGIRLRGSWSASSPISFSTSPSCPSRPCFAKAIALERNKSACRSCLRYRLSFLAQCRGGYWWRHNEQFLWDFYYLCRQCGCH